VAEILSFVEVARARRRAQERRCTAECTRLIELNLRVALHDFAHGPAAERPVRARQVRQLAELLEYVSQA
jgi:hypothetical protein